jgi:hypothetical protein
MFTFASRVGRGSLALTLVALSALGSACTPPSSRYTSSVAGTSPISAGGSTAAASSGDFRTSSSLRTLTHAEFADITAFSAYDIVLRLRPEYLRATRVIARGQVEPVVYVDGIAVGSVAALKELSPDAVAEIRHVTAPESYMLHGPKHEGAVILVRTRR